MLRRSSPYAGVKELFQVVGDQAVNSPFESRVTIRGLTDQIQCPVLVCNAENDQFFQGQPERLAEALGIRATHRELTEADAAGEHCHVGASDVVGRAVMDWLEDTFANI